MMEILIQDTSLISIADEIRTLLDTTDDMTPSAMSTRLRLANAEVSTQETMLEDALSLLENKTITVAENCNLEVTLTNFTGRIIVIVHTHLNDAGQIETSETELSASGTYNIPTLKDCQILFMGVSGSAPSSYISEGSIYGVRSYSYSIYYAYCFVCTGDCGIDFIY